MIEITKEIFGYPITVTAAPAGSDWNVVILGGCAPHVGSVSLAEFRDNMVALRTLQRDTHKDQIVGERFARILALQQHCTVCVSCGIHFHNPNPEDLKQIVSVTETLLSQLCERIK